MQGLADDVYQSRTGGLDCFCEYGFQFIRIRNSPSLQSESFRNLGMIRHPEVHRKITLLVAGLLPGLDPAVDRVGDHDEGNGQLEPHGSLELAGAHAEAAIAHHRDRLHRGPAEMRADRGGERIAERAVRTIGEIAPPGALDD